MLHFRISKREIYFFITGIIILAIPFTVFLAKQQQETRSGASGPVIGSDTVALVNGEPVQGSEYEKSKSCLSENDPTDPDVDDKALDTAVDEKVLSKWAKDNKVSVTNREISDEAVRINGLNPSECDKKIAKVNILRDKLSQNLVKFREGKLIVINFGRYNLGPPYGQIADPIEREKLRLDEKAYADKLLETITNSLKSGSISFDDALKAVREDERVGVTSWYSSTLQSSIFTADDYIKKSGLLVLPEVREKIDDLKIGSYSEPIILKTSTSLTDTSAKEVEVRYVIARVDRIGTGFSGNESQLLKKTREKYKTQILK